MQPFSVDPRAVSEPSQVPVNKLRKVDRERLIAAHLQGKKEIMLLLAAKNGMNASLARELTSLGAVLRFRDDDVDYLRVKIPLARVVEVGQLNSVEVLAVDGLQLYNTSHELTTAQSKKTPPPDINTPAENPYLPTVDIGAPQFVREHPTFDGRGVTIANVDGNSPDMLAPELQTALSLDGTPVPKFSDVINALDPLDDEASIRIDMANEIEARNGRFEWEQTVYQSPGDGKYRLGFFQIDAFGEGLLRTYLPQLPREMKLLTVLWQEETNHVWVDTNFNGSLKDETPLTDFNSSYRAGVLGVDNPSTPLRESVAFTILIDAQHKLVYLAPLANGHATGTASVAAGHNFFGGKMNGVAPAARIASVLRKSIIHSYIEGMILTVKNPRVDLISVQWAAVMPPQDGNSVLSIIVQRLIERYKKPIFSSAGNSGPGLHSQNENSSANGVIGVGGYESKRTWQSNYGISIAANDTLVNLSARGPRADGALKPDLIAPVAAVSADFGVFETRMPVAFDLPPGYLAAAGTSYSCPMASGAAALLISAAKQSNVPYDAKKVAWAMKSSARFIPGVGAHEQGNGLINVPAAWEALKQAPPPAGISSVAAIHTAVGPYLKTPNQGPGIYEREGWRPGQSGQRTITFTRGSGSAAPINYRVRWTGNDGTFTSATTLSLPLNKPVSFPVTIDVKAAGMHSAILNLDDETQGIRSVYQVLNSVIAADQFNERENFKIVREGSAEYPSFTSYFFNVPDGASAFRVDLAPKQGNVKLRFIKPTGKELDSAFDTPGSWPPEYHTSGRTDRFIASPEPGVWEVIVENQNLMVRGDSESHRARFIITATILGTATAPPLREYSATSKDPSTSRQVSFANAFASFDGYYDSAPLASLFSTHTTVARETVSYELNVPQGANALKVKIDDPSGSGADVDLYLYFCAQKCELKAFSARNGAREQVTIKQPKEGKWTVVIDPVSLPSGTLTLDYQDLFTHAAFGSLTPETNIVRVAQGGTVNRAFDAVVDAVPVNGRRLVGLVELLTREPVTVRYVYNAATKTIEPVKERAVIAQSLIKLPMQLNQLKSLTGEAGQR